MAIRVPVEDNIGKIVNNVRGNFAPYIDYIASTELVFEHWSRLCEEGAQAAD
jgi:hypothetical protein